jgi:hypothetical protein
MKNALLYVLISLSSSLFAGTMPQFKTSAQPLAPDYSKANYWAALPFRNDVADVVPKQEQWIDDSVKQVDVFYIYPTIYMKGKTWNADVDDKKLNKRIDNYPLKYHTSVFNHVARVYAPRYRQAIIKSYYDTLGNGTQAFDLAYDDLKRAFEYYMKHYNNGRPIIIASHSQGTTHSRRLLKDYFDTPEMKAKLVCAYVVGFEINQSNFSVLKPCDSPTQTGCYITWASFKSGYTPEPGIKLFGDVCVNPISWTRDSISVNSQGGILLNLNKKKLFKTEAQIHQNYLWVKTNTAFMRNKDILHLVDYNLFWFDIRRNAALRVEAYLKKK